MISIKKEQGGSKPKVPAGGRPKGRPGLRVDGMEDFNPDLNSQVISRQSHMVKTQEQKDKKKKGCCNWVVHKDTWCVIQSCRVSCYKLSD